MDIHDLLNSFIDRKSPSAARFLYRMWDDQQKAVTYKELRDAIMDGGISMDYLRDWQQDYSVFLTECYAPLVDEAVKEARKMLAAQYDGYLQDPMSNAMEEYINTHGGNLIREVSEGQFRAINTLVRQASLTSTLTVDELARCIRPCIGLTENQSRRAKDYYEQLRADGYSKKDALKKQATYAAKLHRQRADLIAQTEMAYAANYGMAAVIRQNVENGIISSDVEKEWSTAKDERVCPVCGKLHGERVAENMPFSNGSMLPPAHPACRCAVKYILKAPDFSVQNENTVAQDEGIPNKVADGTDISETWERRPDRFDYEIEDVMNAQGFDGLPMVVSPEEFDIAVQQSNFIAQRIYSAPDQETLDAYRNQLYTGKWYVDCSRGGSRFGRGMYSAAAYETSINDRIAGEMLWYQEDDLLNAIETFTLAPGAKSISYNVLKEEFTRDLEKKFGDIGSYAAAKGYDYIRARENDKGFYAVILNRTKVIFRSP